MRNKTQFVSAEDAAAVSDGLAAIHAKTRSWRLAGLAISASGAYARLLVLGQRRPTPTIIIAWREWEMQRSCKLVRVPACPTCGGAHVAADCHGAEVAAVVTLAPGETVRRPGKPDPRPPCYRPRLSRDPVERVGQLEALLAAARQEVEP